MTTGDPSSEALPPLLRERYRHARPIGQGGFGSVFRVEDTRLGRPAAIKLLREEVSDPEIQSRFAREAQVTSLLRHPHIVRVDDFGVSPEGIAYVVYELIEGPNLDEAIRQTPATPEELILWGTQLADALRVAHEAGVVHRDVKPGNILLRSRTEAILCDFGIAARESGLTVQTAHGLILGSPGFMAPELFEVAGASPASDQYALAATLALVSSGSPVQPTDPSELARWIGDGARADLTLLTSGSGRSLVRVLRRALSPDPADRFADLAVFADALRGAVGGKGTPPVAAATLVVPSGSSAPGVPPHTAEPGQRKPWRTAWALAALGGACLLGLALRGDRTVPSASPPPPTSTVVQVGSEGWVELLPETRTLDAKLARAAEGHLLVEPSPRGQEVPDRDWHQQHAQDARFEVTSLAYRRRVEELLEALEAWITALDPGDGAPAAPRFRLQNVKRRLVKILVLHLPHLLADVSIVERHDRNLIARLDPGVGRLWDASEVPPPDQAAALGQAVAAFYEGLPERLRMSVPALLAGPGFFGGELPPLALVARVDDMETYLEANKGRASPLVLRGLARAVGRLLRRRYEPCDRLAERLRFALRATVDVLGRPGGYGATGAQHGLFEAVRQAVKNCSWSGGNKRSSNLSVLLEAFRITGGGRAFGDALILQQILELIDEVLPSEPGGVRRRALWWTREASLATWAEPAAIRDRFPGLAKEPDSEVREEAARLLRETLECGATDPPPASGCTWNSLAARTYHHVVVRRWNALFGREVKGKREVDLDAVASRARELLEELRQAGGPEWETAESVARGLLWRLMPISSAIEPDTLALAASLADVIEFPGRTMLAAELGQVSLAADVSDPRRKQLAALNLTLSQQIAKADTETSCPTLRGDLFGSGDAAEIVTEGASVLAEWGYGVHDLSDFAVGPVRSALLLLRGCPGSWQAPEVRRRIERELGELVRLAERGPPEALDSLCTEMADWTPPGGGDASYLRLRSRVEELCR